MNEQFVNYDNSGLVPQKQMTMGVETGLRVPEFDIDITSEKSNPYKKMEINELALSFYNAGFFNPQMTDQALACLNMMDFTKKEDVMRRISQNGTMQEMMLRYQQLALTLAQKISPQMGEQVAQMILSQGGQQMPNMMGMEANTNVQKTEEHPIVERARSEARASTQAE
jgi:hypothetical protein